MNFLSNKDPVFMQISLSNKIQEKRKTDNVLYKQNYLGTECFFQGFGFFFFDFLKTSAAFQQLDLGCEGEQRRRESALVSYKAPYEFNTSSS